MATRQTIHGDCQLPDKAPRDLVAAAIATLEEAVMQAPLVELPRLCAELEQLRMTAMVRIMTPPVSSSAVTTRDSDDQFLTMVEVKHRTGLSLSYLYELARSGDLPVTAMGRRADGKKPRGYRVRLSALRAWEAAHQHQS